MTPMLVVLSIAGSDSGGGAGIQADLKTFEAHGVFGTTAITSITAQNTIGVRAVFDLPQGIISAQIDAVFDDFEVAAVKIGMLSAADTVVTVADRLRARAAGVPIVIDPVMVATSGDRLLREDAVQAIRTELFPLATVLTPNTHEASELAGMDVSNLDDMKSAAEILYRLGAAAVVVKGGHLPCSGDHDAPADLLTDLLFDGDRHRVFPTRRIETANTHGTGCTLSSSIAANLANGMSLVESVRESQRYVHGAIAHAPRLGHGDGPLMHSWMTTGGRE